MTELTLEDAYGKACQIIGETMVQARLTGERLAVVEAERNELIGKVESARTE